MYAEKITIALLTDGSGDMTAYSVPATGRILTVAYTKIDFTDGVDFTVTLERHGEAIWAQSNVNASTVKYPRVPVQDEVGADATLDGTRKMREPVTAAFDRVKVVIAQGGAAKTGTLTVVVG